MVHVKTPNQPEVPDIAAMRCGVQRQSMRTNVLIHRTGLSEVNKVTFTKPGPEKIFGVPKQPDPEGARDVTTLWKSHQANPNDVPGPDFRSMNKLAAVSGLTTAAQQLAFRKANPVCLKAGEAVKKPPPQLPSDYDPTFVYGMPGTHRTAEQVRNAGPSDPPTKPLLQNQFATGWMKMNALRASEFDHNSSYIPPRATVATKGHMKGAQQSLARAHGAEPCEAFKLSKFKKVPARVFNDLPGTQPQVFQVTANAEEPAAALVEPPAPIAA